MEIYREIVKQGDLGRKIVVATLVARSDSGARLPGSKMLITDQGKIFGSLGGGQLEGTVIQKAHEVLRSGVATLCTIEPDRSDTEVCGSVVQVFLEPVIEGPVVVIVGAGHVGRAVASVASLAGFQVHLADDRSHEETGVPHILCSQESFFKALPVAEDTPVIICTRSHALDYAVLEQALATPAAYIGLLGSRKKRESFFTRLQQNGVFARELSRIVTPVGIEIGARNPQEIGISIMAQLIARYREL